MTRSHAQGSFDQPIHMLLVTDTQGQRIYALESSLYSLGRDPSNSIVIEHPLVSRQHALLVRVMGESEFFYRLDDGNLVGTPSMNGTKVNGHKCQSSILQDGDIISFADTVKAEYHYRTHADATLIALESKQSPPRPSSTSADATTWFND